MGEREGAGGKGEGSGKGVEMTLTLYAHMKKRNKKIKCLGITNPTNKWANKLNRQFSKKCKWPIHNKKRMKLCHLLESEGNWIASC
jgi:hypothetical protein